VNKARVAGEAVAIRKLATGNIMLTIEDEQACTSWLANDNWLKTFGEGAKIKQREFAVIAHGIRVN
jgi:hypothetical protein